MLRVILAIITVLSGSSVLVGQQATLKGTLKSGEGPASFATVSLWAEDRLVDGTYADAAGAFEFTRLPVGHFRLQANLLGSDTLSVDLQLVEGENKIDPLSFVTSDEELATVVVRAQRTYEAAGDGSLQLNLNDELRSYAQQADQLLLLAPGISSDGSGAYLLEGQPDFLVLIDGRRKFADRAATLQFLAQLSPERIASIKIDSWNLTSLGQQEQAGVIDVRLVKDETQGVNGSVRLKGDQGAHLRSGGSFSLNYRKKRWNAFGGLGARYDERQRDVYNQLFTPVNSRNQRLDQDTRALALERSLNWNAGVDYEISAQDVIGLTVNGNVDNNDNSIRTSNAYFRNQENISEDYFSENDHRYASNQFFGNANFAHTGKAKRYKNSVDLSYSNGGDNRTGAFRFTASPSNTVMDPDDFSTGQSVDFQIISLRFEQQLRMGERWYWKSGLLGLRTDIDNRNSTSLAPDNPFGIPRALFNYAESQGAVYNTLWYQLDKTLWSVGLRTEYTDGEVFEDGLVVGQNDVVNWLPSLSVWRTVNERQQYGLQFNTYANRPEYLQILPFTAFESLSQVSVGNEAVRPSQSYVLSFRYILDNKYSLQVRYDYSNDYIPQNFYRAVEDGEFRLTEKTYANVGDLHGLQLRLVVPVTITPWWTSRNTVNSFITRSISEEVPDLDYRWATISLYSFNTFKLPSGYRFTAGLYTNSQGRTNQSLFLPRHIIDLSLQKSFGDWSFRLMANDLLHLGNYRGLRRYGNIRHEFTQRYDTRRFGGGLSYRFGGKKIRGQRQRDRSSGAAESRLRQDRE